MSYKIAVKRDVQNPYKNIFETKIPKKILNKIILLLWTIKVPKLVQQISPIISKQQYIFWIGYLTAPLPSPSLQLSHSEILNDAQS